MQPDTILLGNGGGEGGLPGVGSHVIHSGASSSCILRDIGTSSVGTL